MRITRMPDRHFLTSLLTISLLVIAWVALAPTLVGGQTGYVIIKGTSMVPGLHRDDLVVIRRAASYTVGDVVTCRHANIGPVIHRIIARDGDRFVTQGDNNDFMDPYRPQQQDCIGKFWFSIPRVGGVLYRFRYHLLLAFGGLIIGGLATTSGSEGRLKRRHRSRVPVGAPHAMKTLASREAFAGTTLVEHAFGTFIVVVCALAAFAAFAFTRPPTRDVSHELDYQHTGRWSYTPEAPSDVYESGQVHPGNPIFRRLTDQVLMNFTYQLTSDEAVTVTGHTRLTAELSNSTGWKRSILLQPEQSFHGTMTTLTGTLDLRAVQALIDYLQHQTGIQNQDYTLSVLPQISLQGTLAGQSLESSFSPSLHFRLDEFQLSVEWGGSDTDPLNPRAEQVLVRSQTEPNTIDWMRLSVSVVAVRRWLLISLVPAVLGLLVTGFLYARVAHTNEATQIQAKHHALMIEALTNEPGVVDVADISDLVKLAQRVGHLIFHEVRDGTHVYSLHDLGITYRYTMNSQAAGQASSARSRVVDRADLPADRLGQCGSGAARDPHDILEIGAGV